MTQPAEIAATGFDLPASYRHACRLGLRNLEPWRFLRGEAFLSAYSAVNSGDSDQILLPFAQRSDCRDVACFEVLPGIAEDVRVLQPSPGGYIPAAGFPTFWDWFRAAVEDMIRASSASRPTHRGSEARTLDSVHRGAKAAGCLPYS